MKWILIATVAALFALPAAAQVTMLKIGVLTDMSGPFSDQVGPGSVAAAEMAAEDFLKESPEIKVEVVHADHQNRPDIGSGIARRWVDTEGVDAMVDLPNSGVALAVIEIMKDAAPHRTRFLHRQLRGDGALLCADHGAMGDGHLGAR